MGYAAQVMKPDLLEALQAVVASGATLRTRWHFDWPVVLQHAAGALSWIAGSAGRPALVAIVGGASSGKSTVFNNLLEGHAASRITARGHVTLGPIVAIHEQSRESFEAQRSAGALWPGYCVVTSELDGNIVGAPGVLTVVFHSLERLRGVWLLDTPDFTSEAAHREGDVALSLLPWFDRLLVVVDHERWFDRQTISLLRTESARWGQRRMVLFNRTREQALHETDRAALAQQAERLAADGMIVLEFRRGRGLCRFAPGALDEAHAFLRAAPPDRQSALLSAVGRAAGAVLNQNEERSARLAVLRTSLEAVVRDTTPAPWDALTALMTPEERRHLDVVARVLRLHETGRWMLAQGRRLQAALGRVPLIGTMFGRADDLSPAADPDPVDRRQLAGRFYEDRARRQAWEMTRIVQASAFWDEVRRWTGAEPAATEFAWTPAERAQVERAAEAFDRAMAAWTAKVEHECEGAGAHLSGALGAGAVGLAIVLIAVPGPITALTAVGAQAALGAALSHLLAATGAGAVFGKQIGRLVAVAQERLWGSAEFTAVQHESKSLCRLLEDAARKRMAAALHAAEELVVPQSEPVRRALEVLRMAAEKLE